MNDVEAVRKMNERELKLGLAGTHGSWHAKYSHSSVVYVGGLQEGLTEGDVLSVFEQVGRIVHINMVRDAESGKPRGFCFLGYKDQRSTLLAVDNFNGVELYGRVLRVDHVDKYRPPDPGKVNLLDLTLLPDASTEKEEEKSSVKRARPDSKQAQLDEDSRRSRVMQRLALMRRNRTADEAAERTGQPRPSGADVAAAASRIDARPDAAEASLVDEAGAEEARAAECERRAAKFARRAERRLIREEREKRREDKFAQRERKQSAAR
jgi:RNA-binding motif protein, X-linked 2